MNHDILVYMLDFLYAAMDPRLPDHLTCGREPLVINGTTNKVRIIKRAKSLQVDVGSIHQFDRHCTMFLDLEDLFNAESSAPKGINITLNKDNFNIDTCGVKGISFDTTEIICDLDELEEQLFLKSTIQDDVPEYGSTIQYANTLLSVLDKTSYIYMSVSVHSTYNGSVLPDKQEIIDGIADLYES